MKISRLPVGVKELDKQAAYLFETSKREGGEPGRQREGEAKEGKKGQVDGGCMREHKGERCC